MAEIIICSKCNGSGKFQYQSGAIGACYSCNGKGRLKRTVHKSFSIYINDEDGVPFLWCHITARTAKEAETKARKIGSRGCYKDRLDTVTARDFEITCSYHAL